MRYIFTLSSFLLFHSLAAAASITVDCRTFERIEGKHKMPLTLDPASARVFQIDTKDATVHEQGALVDSWFDDLDIWIEVDDPSYSERADIKRRAAVEIHRRNLSYTTFWKLYNDHGETLDSRTLEPLVAPSNLTEPELLRSFFREGVSSGKAALGIAFGKCVVLKEK